MSEQELTPDPCVDQRVASALARGRKFLRGRFSGEAFHTATELLGACVSLQQDNERLRAASQDRSVLKEALRQLANEVSGLLSVCETELRQAASNTNVAVLQLRLNEAREALASADKVT